MVSADRRNETSRDIIFLARVAAGGWGERLVRVMKHSPSQIGVYLRGGLGNQLFGWAAAYAVSRRTQLPLALIADSISKKRGAADVRAFELDYFGLLPAANTSYLGNTSHFAKIPFTKRIRVISETSYEFDRRVVEVREPVVLEGYFQNPNYFEEYQGEISNFLERNARRSHLVGEFSALFGDNWVAVHVRRGDYERFADIYTLPSEDYYSRALSLVRAETGPQRVVVFSDDIDSARLLVPGAAHYIGQLDLPRVGDALMLMASASNLIGANSTLSWWAAFLAPSSGGRKIFPRPWFRGESLSAEGLLLDSWTLLDAD